MTDYLEIPTITDPDELAQIAFDRFQLAFDDWVPNAGDLETIATEAWARIAGEVANVAARVQTAIFRRFGPLAGILPIDASSATVPTTWTMQDTAGYTIPAGTLIGIRTSGGELVTFQVATDVVVAAGASVTAAGEVICVATEAGAAGSGLGAPAASVELVDVLTFVTGVVQTAISTGGVDAEEDAVYLARLVGKLQLLSPAPILPNDFAVLALDTPGVARATAIDLYNPNTNEQQSITVASATGGTFTLTFSGQTTAAIAYNANIATVQAALEALSNIDPGDIGVTGGPLMTAPIVVEFKGQYLGTNVAVMTRTDSTTGTGHTVTIATVRDGASPNNWERMVTVAVVDSAGNPPGGTVLSALDANLQALREVNFVVNVITPTYTTIDVTTTFTLYPGYTAADVQARVAAAISDYLNPSNWGVPTTGDDRVWLQVPAVYRNELIGLVNNVVGVDRVVTVTLAKAGGALGTADVTLAQPAGLTRPGTITGTAV